MVGSYFQPFIRYLLNSALKQNFIGKEIAMKGKLMIFYRELMLAT
ncbi:hypothetical protein Cha6605_6368 (plasmid) [Chamaesiphon minutus PCC 6605]|uniref:Uncharacterized protein n=1 Tax=Chamaesiphon minutus (strain ATCC 27169 / PCC 6605) TaxID=1173020 RepID=K9UQW6_CHAP6|nr:hypothetical protein Cha6605_6368 [Chamaesiphon minutus PCC 6605]